MAAKSILVLALFAAAASAQYNGNNGNNGYSNGGNNGNNGYGSGGNNGNSQSGQRGYSNGNGNNGNGGYGNSGNSGYGNSMNRGVNSQTCRMPVPQKSCGYNITCNNGATPGNSCPNTVQPNVQIGITCRAPGFVAFDDAQPQTLTCSPNDQGMMVWNYNLTNIKCVPVPEAKNYSSCSGYGFYKFQRFKLGKTWDECKAVCQSETGSLMSINSTEEKACVTQRLSNCSSCDDIRKAQGGPAGAAKASKSTGKQTHKTKPKSKRSASNPAVASTSSAALKGLSMFAYVDACDTTEDGVFADSNGTPMIVDWCNPDSATKTKNGRAECLVLNPVSMCYVAVSATTRHPCVCEIPQKPVQCTG